MKRILYPNGAGGICIVVPSPNWEGTMDEMAAEVVPKGTPYSIVDTVLVPTDRTFRNAWEWNAGEIQISFVKAQELTRERLRREREPLLLEQDVLFLQTIEKGQDTLAIITEKQRLRDITNSVDTCHTLDELKNLTIK